MTEYSFIGKLIEQLGTTGLIIFLVWKLVDRWAGRFLEVMGKQAMAMGDLAAAVRDGQGEQRDLLLAVRVMATKIDETMGLAREIAKNCQARGGDKCPKP